MYRATRFRRTSTCLAYVDATYQSKLTLTLANNPDADANGNILVTPGNKIPGISPLQFKLGGDYKMTSAWTLGGDVIANSGQYYVGDDSNKNARLGGYTVFNVHSAYQLTDNIRLFAKLDNALNRQYATPWAIKPPINHPSGDSLDVFRLQHQVLRPSKRGAVFRAGS
ncbi:TonB-dependent receptor domain-containing protein [Pseudomonas sp. GG8]